MIEGSGSGYIPPTTGSGSRRPKNIRIRRIRIRIRNTAVSQNIFIPDISFCLKLSFMPAHYFTISHHTSCSILHTLQESLAIKEAKTSDLATTSHQTMRAGRSSDLSSRSSTVSCSENLQPVYKILAEKLFKKFKEKSLFALPICFFFYLFEEKQVEHK